MTACSLPWNSGLWVPRAPAIHIPWKKLWTPKPRPLRLDGGGQWWPGPGPQFISQGQNAQAVLGGGSDATISWRNSYEDTTDTSTYTFSSADVGTASSGRLVVVAVHARSSLSRTLDSVTIGGNSATLNVVSESTQNNLGICSYNLTTGTTADVVVTFSNTMARCSIGVWALDSLASFTPTVTDHDTIGTSLNPTVQPGAMIVAAAISSQVAARAISYSGSDTPTERYDFTSESFLQVIGYDCLITETTGTTISWTGGTNSTGRHACAIWS